MADVTPTPIIVWCHPRSVSSAFERAFMQRKDTRSYHEPLSMPFYYGEQRACRRYSDAQCQATSEGRYWQSTIERTLKGVLADAAKGTEDSIPVGQKEEGGACRYIFIKDMAQYVFSAAVLKSLHPDSAVYKSNGQGTVLPSATDNPTVLSVDLLRRFKHTFLMRTPKKSVPSYWKCAQDGAAGFEYFDAAEAGYTELRMLYDWMANPQSTFHTAPEADDAYKLPGQVQAQPMPPPLVDASDLLARPDEIVGKYCGSLGVPFDKSMLSWESGKVSAFSTWQGYHTAAENSTGFKQETPAAKEAEEAARSRRRGNSIDSGASSTDDDDAKPNKPSKAPLPDVVLQAIDANMDAYNYLYHFRSFKAAAATTTTTA